jgi:2'-5' RNA ligase
MLTGRQVSRLDPFSEIGTTGLKQYGGFVMEEWLSQLQGKRAAWVWREMADNSAVIGAILFAIRMLSRQVEWRVESDDDSVIPRANMTGPEFVESCMHDMSHTWGDFVSEALSFLQYGWAFHEEVLKKRNGELPSEPPLAGEGDVPETQEDDRPASSKFDDGLIGWRKLPIRAQETLLRWRFRGYAGLLAMEQVDWHGGVHTIPIEKALLFRTEASRGNPEGRSILRSAYQPYYYMQNIQTDEAIGISRDLTGIPKAKAPDGVDIFAPQHKELLEQVKLLVTSIEKDEQQGVVMPAGWELDLMKTGGSRQVDTDPVLRRYRQEIAASVLADFILVGLDDIGSYAMVDVKAELFGITVDAVLDMLCEVMNRYAIPRLFRVNGFKVKALPRIAHSSAGRIDLEKVANFLYNLAGAGAQIPWSQELLEQLFSEAGLPANFSGETTEEIHKSEDVVNDVMHCARCGGNHKGIRFSSLTRPVEQDGGVPLTHVAICPATGQPILMGKEAAPLSKADTSGGAMVALYPSPEVAGLLAQPGGESGDTLHVTLAYLGDAKALKNVEALRAVVQGIAASSPPVLGAVSGIGHFTAGPEPVTYASVDAPTLPALRERLVGNLDAAGFSPSGVHGFTPHITLAYDSRDLQVENCPLTFGEIALTIGGKVERFPLRGVAKAQEADEDAVAHVTPALTARQPVLSMQLEHEVNRALGHLGEEAATAYLSIAQKAKVPGVSALVQRVMSHLGIAAWIADRLKPLLRNHAGRVAGDTQATLQHELDLEVKVGVAGVERMEEQAGRKLNVRDIEPQVRDAITRAIDEGLRAGDNPERTAQRIREMVPAGRFVHAGPAYRSRLIARQETLHLQRLASLAAYESSPRIESVRVRDGIFGEPRSDEECIDRSGETIPLDEATALAPELHPQCTVSYDPVVSPVAQPVAV